MAVKIRMTRMGRRHRPFFRINAIDSRTPRDGRILEKLGHYDPIAKNPEEQLSINLERIKYWLDHGAIPSDTVSQILRKQGIETRYEKDKAAKRAKAKAQARKAGKFFTKAEKILADKQAEAAAKAAEDKIKAEADAKAKAEADAKAKAEAQAKAAEEKAQAEAKAAEEKAQAQAKAAEEPEAPAEEAPAEPQAAQEETKE